MRPAGGGLEADMSEQPAAVGTMLARRSEVTERLAAAGLSAGAPPAGVLLVARGSSDHAAVYGRYLFELVLGRPAALASPSLYTRYGARPRLEGWLAVALSQSGETPEIVTALDVLRGCGARGVAVTNDGNSPLAEAADAVLELGCGPERAVPATKTLTASLAALAVLAACLAPRGIPWTAGDEEHAVDAMARVLADPAAAAGARGSAEGAVTHLGRGLTVAAAMEGALKMREMTGRPAEALSAADYLHGPIAAASSTWVVAYVAAGPVAGDVLSAAGSARQRGATVLQVGPPSVTIPDQPNLAVPEDLAEALAVLPLTVRAQQLAAAAAGRAGVDTDRPFGLTKVTPTY